MCDLYQGNRNPFIDFPELAARVWGSSSGYDDLACHTVFSDDVGTATPSESPTPSIPTADGE